MSRVVPVRKFSSRQKKDPGRTAGIVQLYIRTLAKKLDMINKAIRAALVTRDVFGLNRKPFHVHEDLPPLHAWASLSPAGQNKAFGTWLQDVLNTTLLEDTGLAADVTPTWIQTIARAAYSKGMGSALTSVQRVDPSANPANVAQLIATPFHRDRLEQLFDRNFTELKGFSSSMGTNLQRIIADGLLQGDNPNKMASAISARLGIEKSRATRIARTETIRTNAEAQLNTFERFGIQNVSLDAEWITAGDDRVCPECDDMAGKQFTIDEARGMIPLHISCRCGWLAVQESDKKEADA